MSGRQEHLRPLESCTRPYGPTGDFHQFARFTAEELIQNLFWAAGPADAGWHWHRAVSTWSFPSLCHKLAHQNNLKEIYAIWQNMPLAVDPPARGHHSAEKGRLKLQRHTAIRKEVKTFAQEMGLKKLPSDVDSWRHLYQEMGKFLAAQSFLTHTPPCVMELPPAAIHDFKTHLRERAICDERISLPLSAFKELVYSKLAAQFGTQEAMVEVKVNWRSPM